MLRGGRLLLDSHVWLWWRTLDPKLGSAARAAITNAHEACISAASAWEFAIKKQLGKLKISSDTDLATVFSRAGFVSLAITSEHAMVAAALPPIHKDPFDRMLVAQAKVEGLTLVTADPLLARYDVSVLAPE
ncbi:MAG TPA: type II toxin-antitoxin system VapC family toxin [Gemmatimonadaceae bacterium]